MELPSGFVTMMRDLLGEETDSFLLAMSKEPVVSVRKNIRKPSTAFSHERLVGWCDHGYYLKERPVFTLDPLLHAGAYYVQDASSMIYYETVRRIVTFLRNESDPHNTSDFHPVVLDLCAAPGGKTTAMIDALPDGSRVIANEYVGKRAAILKENLTKWGYPLVTVSNHDSGWFAEKGDQFDIVAVDAPCSGEGMMRKDRDAVAQWSPQLVGDCALLQKEILTNAARCVKPGGFLIYSTCTFNRQENEENASFVRESLGMIPFEPAFPDEWGILRGFNTDLPVYRFMPHKTEGEGLFLAIFRKPGKYEAPRSLARLNNVITSKKNISNQETRRGKLKPGSDNRKTKEEPPEIETILSTDFDKTAFPIAELSLPQALAYLRRESIVLDPDVARGIVVVAFEGHPLGAVKNIGSRANNLYPKNWRILMR